MASIPHFKETMKLGEQMKRSAAMNLGIWMKKKQQNTAIGDKK